MALASLDGIWTRDGSFEWRTSGFNTYGCHNEEKDHVQMAFAQNVKSLSGTP